MSTITKQMTFDTIDRQKSYVAAQKAKGQGLGVVFADAFLRGMRDLGYKNPAWALAEMLDNSFQAAADTVEIRFGYSPENKTKTKPDQLAVIDNGNGIYSEMLGYAVRWGGTDREGDRTGFGRYGYGLPSSAVSMAKRYSVYSKSKSNGEVGWYRVTIDIDELAAAAGDIPKTERLLTAVPAQLPTWIQAAAKSDDKLIVDTMATGTVVVLEDMDRLNHSNGWIKGDTLRTKLLQHFGIIYRHWIPERRITVDGAAAAAVDPLFLMEHGRFFDETPIHAERVEGRTIEVETSRGTKGRVTIRASYLPPHFQLEDPSQYNIGKPKLNKRFPIMREYNGLLICRENRQIDCISPNWTKFQNYDFNVKIELNFDAELDEFFGITTSKQQIMIEESMLERLKQSGSNGGGLIDLVRDMRRRFIAQGDELEAAANNKMQAAEEEQRPSELAMEATEKFKGTAFQPAEKQAEEADRNLKREADRRSEATGRDAEEVLEELKAETTKKRWELDFQSIQEGPFYRPNRLGLQKHVVLNTDHPFYKKVYEPADPAVRAALEVLLFVLAERELEVTGEAEGFYRSERNKWSERLRYALETLTPEEAMANKRAAAAERLWENLADANLELQA